MKYIITGGAGFIGSRLGLSLVKQGKHVVMLDNLSYGYLDNIIDKGNPFGTFLCKDIRTDSMEGIIQEDDIVIHLAGISSLAVCQSQPGLAYDVNVSGTARVLEAARKGKARRVIFASTSAVYENTIVLPYHESDCIEPNLVYSLTKHAGEKLCKGFADCYEMDIIIVRFFNVYGPHQDSIRITPPFTSYLARELFHKRSPIIFNQSQSKRDYIYITDLIRLLYSMMHSTTTFRADIFNATSSCSYTIDDIYKTFQEVSHTEDITPIYSPASTIWDAFPSLFIGYKLNRNRIEKEVYKTSEGNNQKIKDVFEWEPVISLKDGITAIWETTINSYTNYHNSQ